jgi:hypothetical protein
MLSFEGFDHTKRLALICKMLFGSHQLWIINFTVNGVSSFKIERQNFSLNGLFWVNPSLSLLRLILHLFITVLRMLNTDSSLWFLCMLMNSTNPILVLDFPLLIQLRRNIFDGLSGRQILRLPLVLSETNANSSFVEWGNTLKSLIDIHSGCLVTNIKKWIRIFIAYKVSYEGIH